MAADGQQKLLNRPCVAGSAVGLAPMDDLEHQHHQLTVLDVADQPVVAHAVAPESREVGAQPFATLPGVLGLQHKAVQVSQQVLGRGAVEPLELSLGRLRDPKRLGQVLPSRCRGCRSALCLSAPAPAPQHPCRRPPGRRCRLRSAPAGRRPWSGP